MSNVNKGFTLPDKWYNLLNGFSTIAGNYSRSGDNILSQTLGSGISMAAQLNPYTAVADAAIEGLNSIATTFDVDNKAIKKSDAMQVGLDKSAVWGNDLINSKFKFLGMFGKNYKGPKSIQDVGKSSVSHSGIVNDNFAFQNMKGNHVVGGRQLDLLGRNHDKQIEKLNDITYENKRMESNYAHQLMAANKPMIYNGYTPGLTLHKRGGTIPELEEVRTIMQSLQSKKQDIQDPQKFQLGGKMNMIVTGALHARKHNLEELNPNLEGEITKKGIPVVVMNEGGEVHSQQAEVEREEWIIEKSSTEYIENLYNSYNLAKNKIESDKIAIECGKFLVKQLLLNTDDPGKIIKTTI